MNDSVKRVLKALNYPVDEAKDTVNVLRAYQDDMQKFSKFAESKNYHAPNLDRWYHPTAMYTATKGSPYRGLVALGAGTIKELKDIVKYTKETYNPAYAVWESVKDQFRNLGGVGASIFNPNLPAEENNWLKSLQTPTIRAIMPEYREKNGKVI